MIPGIVTLIIDNCDIVQGKPESESAIKSGRFKSQAMFNLSSPGILLGCARQTTKVEVSDAVGDYPNSQDIKFLNTNALDSEKTALCSTNRNPAANTNESPLDLYIKRSHSVREFGQCWTDTDVNSLTGNCRNLESVINASRSNIDQIPLVLIIHTAA